MNPVALLSLLTLGVTILHYHNCCCNEPIISEKDLHTQHVPVEYCSLCLGELYDGKHTVFHLAKVHNSCWISEQFMQERDLDRLTRKNREKELV